MLNTNRKICEVFSLDKKEDNSIMKIKAVMLNEEEFKIRIYYDEVFYEVLKSEKESLTEIAESLFKCVNNSEINKIQNNLKKEIELIDIVLTSNSLNDFIKINVSSLKIPKNDRQNKKVIMKILKLLYKLDIICNKINDNLSEIIKNYTNNLIQEEKIYSYELNLYSTGETILYSGFTQTTNLPKWIEKFNISTLIKEDDLLTLINKELKEKGIIVKKGRDFKVIFDYKDKKIDNLKFLYLINFIEKD